MFQPYFDCDLWCGVAIIYLITFAFVWVPGLLSLVTGFFCSSFMPRLEANDGFKVGLFTGMVMIGLLIGWTVFYASGTKTPTALVLGVYLAFHVLGILVPIIICWYIHSRKRNKWWDLRPRKQL